ncbi:unnamed protein product [Phytophthora fragariaefolia]|uniref:Unnamed protein product n=1 Tax=Phytophthora fragariaefolia TaxID=1490495 RepID=A0A9W6Y766_9STRA|nr:unnamed protein product [Phytophthora fragariaefolia]
MSLGPFGAAMLQARSQIHQGEKSKPRSKRQPIASIDPTTSPSDTPASRLETYFQAAMSRFLKEQQVLPSPPTPTGIQNPGSQDVEMLSAGSPDPDPHWEYDPDDINLPTSDRSAMATMNTGFMGSTMIQRGRISAISDLKEFSGKDQDEDRARAWLGKVKSAFLRDQASDGEKCLTFADLLSGAAKNWYRQLPRSTRNKWTDLLLRAGISAPAQRPWLTCTAKIKDGIPKEKREHVDHFIETLGDQELADRLTPFRLPDVDELEIQAPDSGSDDSGSEWSDSDCDEHRRIYTAANQDNARSAGEESNGLDRSQPDRPQHDRMTHGTDPRSISTDPPAVAVRTMDLRSIRILDAGDV